MKYSYLLHLVNICKEQNIFSLDIKGNYGEVKCLKNGTLVIL